MKILLVLIPALIITTACGKNSNRAPAAALTENSNGTTDQLLTSSSDEETDDHVMTPEEEEAFLKAEEDNKLQGKASHQFKFPQTSWKECTDLITGNYYGYKCSNGRKISQILKKFMDTHIAKCVDRGLAAQGGGKMDDLHIVHAGIFGDPRHSPRSMHAENRAIDIKSMEVKLTNGQVKKFVYAGTTNRAFYQAFRQCWGEVVKVNNNCPYYKGTPSLTATIGWEDKNHRHHMHTSVPYCVGGQYAGFYYRK